MEVDQVELVILKMKLLAIKRKQGSARKRLCLVAVIVTLAQREAKVREPKAVTVRVTQTKALIDLEVQQQETGWMMRMEKVE